MSTNTSIAQQSNYTVPASTDAPTPSLQTIGGIAAIIEGLTYIVGFGMGLGLFEEYFSGELSRSESVLFVVENDTSLFIWNLIIYVINGIFLVVLVQALHDRLKAHAPALSQTASAFGMIWAGLVIASGMLAIVNLGAVKDMYAMNPEEAGLALETLSTVQNGLGGGIEVVGGIWIILASWAALRSNTLPKGLNILGLIIGLAGVVTVVPALKDFGAIFGLGFIGWFLWAGVALLRNPNPHKA